MSEIIDISPIISERTAVWPGDVPFSRVVSCSIDNGDSLELSSINTTLHVGAHADAPSHYKKDGVDIAKMPLSHYYGPCQVIEARVPRGIRIIPEYLKEEVLVPRVLLKTGTFPDPNHFNTDFAAISPALVDDLSKNGVVLVGIDSPSMDLFDDKELIAHQALAEHGMANLEALDLGHVEPGVYTLIALPLRLEGSDASPVRAALVREPRFAQLRRRLHTDTRKPRKISPLDAVKDDWKKDTL